MVDKVTKTVKVPESTAKDWDHYVEKNEVFESVSHLIRLSVQRQMEGKYEKVPTTSDNSDNVASGEVLTRLQAIQTGLEDMEDRLRAIEDVEEAEASYDLRKAVYSFLPVERDTLDYGQWAMTASELAQKLGADESDVNETLERLDEETGQVSSVTGGPDSTTYWFKRGMD